MQQSRRKFVAGVGGILVTSALGSRSVGAQQTPMFAYVGSFSRGTGAGGPRKGINVFRVEPNANQWTHIQQLAELPMPNILAFDRRQRYLYAVDGADRDHVSAFSIDARIGQLTALNRHPTGGTGGMFAIVDPTNRYLLITHVSGTIAVFPIAPDGSLGSMTDSFRTMGTFGPHKTQQITPQPHHVQFDRRGRFLFVPSKGFDLVHVFTLDTTAGKLIPHNPPSVASRAGAGSRHIALHPTGPYAYVVNELDSTVTTYRFDEDKGTLEPLQVIPSLPTTFTGNNTASGIIVARSGRFVYASNRGHDSVAIFAVENAGVLAHMGWESTRGRTPRYITFDPAESFLYAANQGSNNIVAFRVNRSSGALSPPTGYVAEVDAPTCIVFATPGATSSSR